MNTRHHLLLLPALLLFLQSPSLHAQPPQAPDWVALPKTYIAYNDSLVRGEIVDAFYLDAIPLGDVDNSGTEDFALHVKVLRLDSLGESESGERLMIYRGEPRVNPAYLRADTLALAEYGSSLKFLAAGDWDNDNDIDLCISTRILGDTSNGNAGAHYELYRIVVFWNDGDGKFSLQDTTRLPSPSKQGNDVWVGVARGFTYDWNNDLIDDLLLHAGGGYADGKVVMSDGMNLYYGLDGDRWNQEGNAGYPAWSWWNIPDHNRVRIVDQNCDNLPDLVFFSERGGIRPDLFIFYGSAAAMAAGLPDTTDADTLSFFDVSGSLAYAELEDYTSDGVLDLIVSGEDRYWRVYVGRPGARISEVYGSGDEPADPENGYPDARPWTRIPMPGRVGAGWGSPIYGPIKLLGDVNGDGWRDLWSIANLNVIVYSAGSAFDAWIDGYVSYGGTFMNLVTLGDIDGSGVATHALVNRLQGKSAVQFFKSDASVPWIGTVKAAPANHTMWEPTPNRCGSSVGVEEEPVPLPDSLDLTLKSAGDRGIPCEPCTVNAGMVRCNNR